MAFHPVAAHWRARVRGAFAAATAFTVLILAGCSGGSEAENEDTANTPTKARAQRASNGPLAVSAGDIASSFYSESGKLMRADENVGALGNDLFGERVNLYDGTTEFVQTDVSLQGNSALPVSVGRRLAVGNAHLVRGHFGDWDLDIPHMHGIFSTSGWKVGPGVASATTARCTQFGPPPQVLGQSNQGTFNPVEYWHGNFLYVPGQGSQEILKANTSAAAVNPTGALANAGVTPIKLTTKNRWTIICGPTVRGGTTGNEGFIAISPDGTRYQFDQMVSRPYPLITKPIAEPPQRAADSKAATTTLNPGGGENFASTYILKRSEVWILPSVITDRFGNQVTYTYASGGSWQLTSITSTESSGAARSITFQYQADANNPNLVSSVSDGTRTWTYGYGDYYNAGTLYGKKLTSVTLPTGGGSWSIDMISVSTPGPDQEGTAGCGAASPAGQPGGIGTMIHPSGAQGTFKFAPVIHGRSYVVQVCQGNEWEGAGWSYYPLYFTTYAIQSKTLSGPGLPAVNLALADPGGYTWKYKYYDDGVTIDGKASWSTCSGCPDTKTVTVTDPQLFKTRYTFGTRFQATEGQLLQVDEGWSGSGATRSTTHQYAAPTAGPYPDVIGYSVQARTAGDLSTRYAPEKLRVINQQAATFTWQVNRFDRLARPFEVTRYSSLGYSRTEQTVYTDIPLNAAVPDSRFTDPWVLGVVSAVNRLNAPFGSYQEEIEGHAIDYTYLKPSTNRSFGLQIESLAYHPDGNLRTRADGLGQTTTFANYKFGLAGDVTYADGTNEHAEVNGLGLITSVRNAAGTTTGYGYDVAGRLNSITPPSEANMAYWPTILSFDQVGSEEVGLPANHWRQVVTTNNARTERYFDALWRPVLTRTWDTSASTDTSRAVLKRFDWGNRVTFESYPVRNAQAPNVAVTLDGVRRYYDDALGRMTRLEQDSELGTLTAQTVYGSGFTRTNINPRGYATTAWFQAFDTPSENAPVSLQLPEGVAVGIGRDDFGKPKTITRAGGSKSVTRSYFYDGNQRLCKTVEPETGATIQQLDAAGNLSWRASGLNLTGPNCDQGQVPAGNKINHTYDLRNRLKVTSPGDGSPGAIRNYTADGLLSQISVPNYQTWTYFYNNRRLLTEEQFTWSWQPPAGGWNFVWDIDAYGHVSALRYPWNSYTTNFQPNALGQPTQVSGYANNAWYHPNGALGGYVLGNGITHTLGLNRRGLPLQAQSGTVTNDTYSYDADGNVIAIADNINAANNRSMPTYDGLDRLKVANGSWGSASYTYDAVDNLVASTVGGRTLTHQVDPTTNRLIALTGSQNIGVGYDPNGNVISRGGQAYTFDIANRMSSALGKVASYTYDGNGRRVAVNRVDGSATVYGYSQNGKMLYTWDSVRGDTHYVYLGDKLIAETDHSSSATTYSHTDALGSPVATTNAAGAVLTRTHYEPYGATVAGSTNPPRIGFTGHVNDPDTGLVYMQQRYYDPIAGRFLSVDPIVDAYGGSNFGRYHYANNNPYAFTDPTGMAPEEPKPPEKPKPPEPPKPPCNEACMRMRAISNAHDLGESTTTAAAASAPALAANAPGSGSWGQAPQVNILGLLYGIWTYSHPGMECGVDVECGVFSGPALPALQRIHSVATLTQGSARYATESVRKMSTADIVKSLKPGSAEALKVKADGRILDGNTRVFVLQERGYNVNTLPRVIIP